MFSCLLLVVVDSKMCYLKGKHNLSCAGNKILVNLHLNIYGVIYPFSYIVTFVTVIPWETRVHL